MVQEMRIIRTAIIMCGFFIVMAGIVRASSVIAEEEVIAFAVVSSRAVGHPVLLGNSHIDPVCNSRMRID